uniref:Uncharacterized protein n=1 Tax=Caenorhabditis japonica TaxID=281687 RepID=A0A8R1E4S5_CAEJA
MAVSKNHNTSKDITMDLDTIVSKETTPLTQLGEVLFSFNETQLDFGKLPNLAVGAVYFLNMLLEQLNESSSNNSNVFDTLLDLRSKISTMKVTETRNHIQEHLTEFVHILNNISSFVVFINKYKQLTSQTYLTRLSKKVESLLPSVSIIKRLLRADAKKRVIEQLQCIDRLINPRDTLYDKLALIGFPQGSKDITTLLKDLDGNQLKRFLNGGNFLSELKSFLLPMSNLSIQIEIAENVWAKTVKIKNAVRQNLKMFQNMKKLKLTAFTSFLKNVNITLRIETN